MEENMMNEAIETLEGAIATPVVKAPIVTCCSKKNKWVVAGFAIGGTLVGAGLTFGIPRIWNYFKNKKYSKSEVQAKVVKPEENDDDFIEVPDKED